MSFKFFPDEADRNPNVTPEIQLAPSSQIIIDATHYTLVSKLNQNPNSTTNPTNTSLKCVNIPNLLTIEGLVTDKNVVEILNSTSDLKSGVYEGGFKTWECTYDLISHIHQTEGILTSKTPPLRVLDLGCGSGLLGLTILQMATTSNVNVRVDFQDYNPEVLNNVTIPNTLLNFPDEHTSTCRYFSGDWSSFTDLISNEGTKYDLILSSETIYNLEYLPKFLGVVKKSLGDQGSLYLAAKTFYFGVGGGTKAFLSMVEDDEELEAEVVRIFKEGVKREIIRVSRTK